MKMMRALLVVFAVVGICVVSGCATTRQGSSGGFTDRGGLEKQQPSPTANLTAAGKVAYYIGWFSLAGLYGWAGGNVPIFPPQ